MNTIRPPESEVTGHPKEAALRLLYKATDEIEKEKYQNALDLLEETKHTILMILFDELHGARVNGDLAEFRERVKKNLWHAIRRRESEDSGDSMPNTERSPDMGGQKDEEKTDY